MNRRYCFGIASVLYFICFLCAIAVLADAAELINSTNTADIVSGNILVLSGYAATCFCCLGLGKERAKKQMRIFLTVLSVFYCAVLLDFTLIDDNFGRDIFNILSWNKAAFKQYISNSTNIIPFATIRLFIKGYLNDDLTLYATVVNLLGNFIAFMPLPFFIKILSRREYTFLNVLVSVLAAVLAVELLQFIFLTGASDIDDVILNTSGAMLFYFVSRTGPVFRGISKLTFGVWDGVEKKS